jgi:hypothetical protein
MEPHEIAGCLLLIVMMFVALLGGGIWLDHLAKAGGWF